MLFEFKIPRSLCLQYPLSNMQPYRTQSKYVLLFITSLYTTTVSGNNDTCGCYMLGTLGTVDGESMCDNQTLQCKCYSNVIGKNCDQCAEGYYNILSGRGCSSCYCGPLGSVNKSCDPLTGQCRCKPGFNGFRCDRCKADTYKFSSEKCQNCNCNPHGSKNLQCNIVGQCSCLPNAEGKFCDHCKENTHSIQQGCIPCSTCYEFVQNAIKNYTKYLRTIEEAIEGIENNLPLLVQDYKHFLNEIKLLKAKIYKLKMEYEDAEGTISSQEAIDKLSKEAEDFHNEVLNFIQQFDNDLYKKEIKSALYVGRTNLKEANDLVKSCEDALANATKTASSLNRHNKTITLIAKDAIKTSQQIEDEAEDFYRLSVSVNSSCNEACNTAEEFLKHQRTLSDELKSIKNDILNSAEGIEAMKAYSEGFQEDTNMLQEEAIMLYGKANLLDVPNSETISDDLKKINNSLSSINETMKNLTQQADIGKEKEASTENDIEKVKTKQKNIDDNLSLVHSYDERANAAINQSNNAFASAKESLKNLKKIKEIKVEAEEALKRVPDIRAKVDAVLNNADEIENIFRELLEVLKNLEIMQVNLTEILKAGESNAITYSQNFEIVEKLEEEERKLSKKLTELHGTKLKDARKNLKKMQDEQIEIERNITKLQEYILVVDLIPTSKEELDEVEEEIIKMEEMVSAFEYLMSEKERLQKAMENVKDIIESLPIDNGSLCESAKNEPKTSEG